MLLAEETLKMVIAVIVIVFFSLFLGKFIYGKIKR